jgi:hypothetical protein
MSLRLRKKVVCEQKLIRESDAHFVNLNIISTHPGIKLGHCVISV